MNLGFRFKKKKCLACVSEKWQMICPLGADGPVEGRVVWKHMEVSNRV